MTLYWDSTGGSQTALDALDRRDGDAGSSPALLNLLVFNSRLSTLEESMRAKQREMIPVELVPETFERGPIIIRNITGCICRKGSPYINKNCKAKEHRS
jgi:hypothetical protein